MAPTHPSVRHRGAPDAGRRRQEWEVPVRRTQPPGCAHRRCERAGTWRPPSADVPPTSPGASRGPRHRVPRPQADVPRHSGLRREYGAAGHAPRPPRRRELRSDLAADRWRPRLHVDRIGRKGYDVEACLPGTRETRPHDQRRTADLRGLHAPDRGHPLRRGPPGAARGL